MGADETSAQNRHLSLATANFRTEASCESHFFSVLSIAWLSTHTVFYQLAIPPIDTLSDLLAPYSTSSDSHDRVIQYAPRYRLAFTLLNEDAAAGQAVHGWDIQNAITRELRRPFN